MEHITEDRIITVEFLFDNGEVWRHDFTIDDATEFIENLVKPVFSDFSDDYALIFTYDIYNNPVVVDPSAIIGIRGLSES